MNPFAAARVLGVQEDVMWSMLPAALPPGSWAALPAWPWCVALAGAAVVGALAVLALAWGTEARAVAACPGAGRPHPLRHLARLRPARLAG